MSEILKCCVIFATCNANQLCALDCYMALMKYIFNFMLVIQSPTHLQLQMIPANVFKTACVNKISIPCVLWRRKSKISSALGTIKSIAEIVTCKWHLCYMFAGIYFLLENFLRKMKVLCCCSIEFICVEIFFAGAFNGWSFLTPILKIEGYFSYFFPENESNVA